jgi:hypothetical protein
MFHYLCTMSITLFYLFWFIIYCFLFIILPKYVMNVLDTLLYVDSYVCVCLSLWNIVSCIYLLPPYHLLKVWATCDWCPVCLCNFSSADGGKRLSRLSGSAYSFGSRLRLSASVHSFGSSKSNTIFTHTGFSVSYLQCREVTFFSSSPSPLFCCLLLHMYLFLDSPMHIAQMLWSVRFAECIFFIYKGFF